MNTNPTAPISGFPSVTAPAKKSFVRRFAGGLTVLAILMLLFVIGLGATISVGVYAVYDRVVLPYGTASETGKNVTYWVDRYDALTTEAVSVLHDPKVSPADRVATSTKLREEANQALLNAFLQEKRDNVFKRAANALF